MPKLFLVFFALFRRDFFVLEWTMLVLKGVGSVGQHSSTLLRQTIRSLGGSSKCFEPNITKPADVEDHHEEPVKPLR